MATASVIFLHGLGDSGSGFSSLQQEAPLPWARWSFPDASAQPVTCNGGMSMPSWFDIESLPLGDSESAGKPRGVEKAVSAVHAMLRQSEALGFAPSRTLLGGFSQGAALALLAGLSYDKPLAGIIALSGWAMRRGELKELLKQRDVPIFLGHGRQDPTVPCRLGQAAEQALRANGCTAVELHTYAGLGHSASAEELHDLHHFMRSRLPQEAPRPPPEVAGAAPPRAAARTAVVVKGGSVRLIQPEYQIRKEDGKLLILVELPGIAETSEMEVDLASTALRVSAGGKFKLDIGLPSRVDLESSCVTHSRRREMLKIEALQLQG